MGKFHSLKFINGWYFDWHSSHCYFFCKWENNGYFRNLGNLITIKETDQKFWRIIFILGVLIGPLIFILLFKEIKSEMVANTTLLIISGFLVGLGTSLGNGCTSGHGICGLSRFSIRSIVANLVFVISGMFTVYLINGNLL